MKTKSEQKKRSHLERKTSESWLARLEKVESPDVTFRSDSFPIVMKRARGMVVVDVDGNRYRDFTACFGVLALGHRSEVVANAVRKQSANLIHGMGDVHPAISKIRLLELLAEVSPFEKAKTVLGLSGSDALEAAIKTAMLATGRHQFLSFSGGYHGLSFGPLAMTDREHFRAGFEPWLKNRALSLPFPMAWDEANPPMGCYETLPDRSTLQSVHAIAAPEDVLAKLEKELSSKNYAAVIVEPVQGRGGDRCFPKGFLARVAELARYYGSLVIFDEIFCGFGRTGTLFAHEQEGVKPDLLCVGKALGGGFPLSACIGECLDVWGKSKGEARHTSTFLGHPLACAVGVEVVRAIGKRLPEFCEENEAIESVLADFCKDARKDGLHKSVPFIVQGRGFMRGLWFFSKSEGFAAILAEQLLQEGILALPSGVRGDVLSLTPPLIATAGDYRKFLSVVRRLLACQV